MEVPRHDQEFGAVLNLAGDVVGQAAIGKRNIRPRSKMAIEADSSTRRARAAAARRLQRNQSRCTPKARQLSGFFHKKKLPFTTERKGALTLVPL